MNPSAQQALDRIKAEDEANDRITDRVHVEIMREHIHDNLDMLPAETRRKLEIAEDIYSKAIKKCFLSLRANMK